MLNKIMIKDVACKVCRDAGVSFIGTHFEMAFHLINNHKNIHTLKPLASLVYFLMKEVVSQPPTIRRLDVMMKRLDTSKLDLPDGWLHLSSSSSFSGSPSSLPDTFFEPMNM